VRLDGSGATAREVWLEEMSPTITENLVMLATGLPGTTKIVGAASEPHVQDLCRMLMSAGVSIKGLGSSVLEITGTSALTPTTFGYQVIIMR
jgi:UDP-N-acetylglucosamine 1-carboxyvinyltransferase